MSVEDPVRVHGRDQDAFERLRLLCSAERREMLAEDDRERIGGETCLPELLGERLVVARHRMEHSMRDGSRPFCRACPPLRGSLVQRKLLEGCRAAGTDGPGVGEEGEG